MKDIIKKYREFARRVNPDIKVIKGSNWCCYHNTYEIEIPCIIADSSIVDFMSTVEKQLAKSGNQHLTQRYDDFIWCFLHEMGHLCKSKTYNNKIVRKFSNTLSLLGLHKIAKFFYYRLKEERVATKWACDYVINNPKIVTKYNWELVRRYKKYYKNMNLKGE